MPKVISTLEFRKRLGQHIGDVKGYTVVANEKDHSHTFLIVDPEMMIGLFIEAGRKGLAHELNQTLKDVSSKISARYRRMINKRYETKLYD